MFKAITSDNTHLQTRQGDFRRCAACVPTLPITTYGSLEMTFSLIALGAAPCRPGRTNVLDFDERRVLNYIFEAPMSNRRFEGASGCGLQDTVNTLSSVCEGTEVHTT